MTETDYQYDTLIRLAFATGMRQGELLALKWEDIYDRAIHVCRSTTIASHIDKDGNRVREREVWEPKTVNAIRTIPLLPETEELLRDHQAQQRKYFMAHGFGRPQYVFTNSRGRIIPTQNLQSSFARLLKAQAYRIRNSTPYGIHSQPRL